MQNFVRARGALRLQAVEHLREVGNVVFLELGKGYERRKFVLRAGALSVTAFLARGAMQRRLLSAREIGLVETGEKKKR